MDIIIVCYLLFLAFIKPIINGTGFDFKEVQISEEKRLDIHGLDKGYLLIFNFNRNKEFKEERLNVENKDIFQIFV